MCTSCMFEIKKNNGIMKCPLCQKEGNLIGVYITTPEIKIKDYSVMHSGNKNYIRINLSNNDTTELAKFFENIGDDYINKYNEFEKDNKSKYEYISFIE